MGTGQFHGDEIKARSGERWLALYCTGNEQALRYSRVTIEQVIDPISDEDVDQATGKVVWVDDVEEPLLLLKGAVMLKPGRINTAFVGRQALTNTTDMRLELVNETYRLKVETKDHSSIEAVTSDDARLVLIHGAQRQVLYGLGGKGAPTEVYWSLRWAGDIDGDGKIDVYVDASDHYNVSALRLFLSSQATPRQLLKQIAVFRTVGC
jgi:hypothetical protein